MTGFFSELKRRNVIRVAGLYVVGGWLLLQVADVLFGLLDVPEGSLRLVFGILVLGLPIALVFAWAYELTPEGIKRDRDVDRSQSITGETGRKLNMMTMGLAALAIGAVILDRLIPEQAAERAAEPAEVVSEPAGDAVEDAPVADARPSIAVLPFENRSKLEDDAFFVDGIHDDILTQLSKIGALKVISRTSVERFRDTELSMQEIAGQLGVTQILEGGVQRAGDRVRINVQLIDAQSDEHLWAETYDRELTAANIFAIQSEVASAISGALKTTLTPAEKRRADTAPTDNLEAWEAYQLGKRRMARRASEDMLEAERFFRRSIELDPEFALAWVGLADTLNLQTAYSGAPSATALAEAEKAAGKALDLDPDLAEAWASAGLIASQRDQQVEAGRRFRRAIELNPNYATAHHWYGINLGEQGRLDEALEHARRAVALDPLATVLNMNLAGTLDALGQFDEAEALYWKVIEIDPSMPWGYRGLAQLRAYVEGDFVEAVAYQRKAVELDPGGQIQRMGLVMLYLDLVLDSPARALAEAAVTQWPDHPVTAGMLSLSYLYGGDMDRARQHLTALYERDPRFALGFVSHADLARGDPESALGRFKQNYPELLVSPPAVNTANYQDAINLALVLQQVGDEERAATLLSASERILAERPRKGETGYGIADVRILSLRGKIKQALAALRRAEQAGWRGPLWRYSRDFDPAVESIRDEPEFKAVFADIEQDMAAQRARLTTDSGVASEGEQVAQ